MTGGEGGNRLPEPLKAIARVAIDALKSLLAVFKNLSETIASALGIHEAVKKVLVAVYAVIIAMILGVILTLRSCAGETDNVAATSTTAPIATTTEPPATTTTTTSTVPEPTTTTSAPILNPVSPGSQEERATATTVKEPSRKITPKTTVAPTTVAPTTTAAPEPTTTLPPTTTTTTIASRVVTFDFQATLSAVDKASTIPTSGVIALTSVDTTAWTAFLPNGTSTFSFKLFRFTNSDVRPVTYVANSTNASCVDGGSQNDQGHGNLSGYYWLVTCTATGSGPISLPIIWEPPP